MLLSRIINLLKTVKECLTLPKCKNPYWVEICFSLSKLIPFLKQFQVLHKVQVRVTLLNL